MTPDEIAGWIIDEEMTVPKWCRYLAKRRDELDPDHAAQAFRTLASYVEELESEVGTKRAANLLQGVLVGDDS